jgi:hypothetical protein
MLTLRSLRISILLCTLFVVIPAECLPATSAVSLVSRFRTVSQEELKMTSEPNAPGAPAIILYREVFRDDNEQAGREDDYLRIKILTEAGRKYADVEIPYDNLGGDIVGIHARTIKPDGTIVDFDGKASTKTVIKA